VQPCNVFRLAIFTQIIDLGIVIMHADVCRRNRVSSKLVGIKGLNEVLKRLRLGCGGSRENSSGDSRCSYWFH
jgi:hypothetical protein